MNSSSKIPFTLKSNNSLLDRISNNNITLRDHSIELLLGFEDENHDPLRTSRLFVARRRNNRSQVLLFVGGNINFTKLMWEM